MAEKITRDAFLYMDPTGENQDEFAQCGTCRFSIEGQCCLLNIRVEPSDSCGLYVQGTLEAPKIEQPGVAPDVAGYVQHEVRCENCRYFDPEEGDCELFEMLNQRAPDVFDLDEKVDALGCCNAQTPIGSDGRVGETLEKFSR